MRNRDKKSLSSNNLQFKNKNNRKNNQEHLINLITFSQKVNKNNLKKTKHSLTFLNLVDI